MKFWICFQIEPRQGIVTKDLNGDRVFGAVLALNMSALLSCHTVEILHHLGFFSPMPLMHRLAWDLASQVHCFIFTWLLLSLPTHAGSAGVERPRLLLPAA